MGVFMKSRAFGFVVVFFSYLIAAAVGIVIFHYTASPLWLRVLVADLGATGVIYLFSMIVHNASLYDPYWSEQPVLILFLLASYLHVWDMGSILLLAAILFWGVRLTANCIFQFPVHQVLKNIIKTPFTPELDVYKRQQGVFSLSFQHRFYLHQQP